MIVEGAKHRLCVVYLRKEDLLQKDSDSKMYHCTFQCKGQPEYVKDARKTTLMNTQRGSVNSVTFRCAANVSQFTIIEKKVLFTVKRFNIFWRTIFYRTGGT